MPPLSDAAIRKAKPSDKAVRLYDRDGLYLEISPAGSRLWRQKYRFGGKEKRLAHGTYPEVSLALARARRDEARRLLAQSIDPSEHRKAAAAAKAALGANGFEFTAREWLKGRRWAKSYYGKVEASLENDVFPWIGSRDVGSLESTDFLSIARRIEARGVHETAHRVLRRCGQVMRYAIATGRARRDPVADLRGALLPVEKGHFAAITTPEQLGALLAALHAYRGTPMTMAALKLAPLLFVRPIELRSMEWAELDLDGAQWVIPAAKMKTRREHLVPLAKQAVTLLNEIHADTGRGRYVFPTRNSRGKTERPMSENTVLYAIRALGFDSKTMTGHGFRATARTLLDEALGFRPDIIEHQLAHAVKDPNGRAYNRTTFLPERVAMMQRWADYLDELREGKPAAPAQEAA